MTYESTSHTKTHHKDEIRIDVREWEIKDGKQIPTKKGISLPLNRWKLLANNMNFVDQALDEKMEYATHPTGSCGPICKDTVLPNSVLVRSHRSH
jgi:hypothetical protein